MESSNPYAPPSVDRTMARENETLYVYRSSSRNPWFVLTSLPIVFATVAVINQLLNAGFQRQPGIPAGDNRELIAIALVSTLLLSVSIFFLAGLIVPRVWSFYVDREFVTWRTPWPRSTEVRVPVSSISRVEYHGPTIAIQTEDGGSHIPVHYTYGGQTEEVIEAIKDAVLERDPHTRVHQHRQIETLSMMRNMGRMVGGAFRLFRRQR